MDFKIISVMALIIMANGKPVDDKLSMMLPQKQLQPLTNELNKDLKSHQSSSHMSGNSIMGTSHPAVGQITQSSSSSQQVLRNPVHLTSSKLISVHKPLQVVIVDKPVTEKFGSVDCNSSSQVLVKQQNDPVESDFSMSKFADIPELENIPSGISWHQFHSYSSSNFYHANKTSNQIIPNNFANRHKPRIPEIIDEFEESANNDFGLINEEADDPVLSDFSANKLSSMLYPGPTVASNASAHVTSVTEANNVQTASNDTVIEAAITNANFSNGNLELHESVTISNNKKTENTPPEEKIVSGGLIEEQKFNMGNANNNSSGQECLSCTEVHSKNTSLSTPSLTKDKLATVITTDSSDQTQDSSTANTHGNQSSTDVSATVSKQDPVVSVGVNSTVSGEGSETHKEHTFLGEISASADSFTENHIRGVNHVMQNESVKGESQFMEEQMLSGGIAVSSTSVKDNEPITVVTAIAANKNTFNKKDSHLDNSSHKPAGSKGTSGISISVNSQEPITIVTAIPYNKETINLVQNMQNKTSNKRITVSTSSANGHEPVTVVWASKPTISHFQNQTFGVVSRPANGHISNEHKPLVQVSFPEISVSSSFVNGQKPVTAVTAINPLTQHQIVGGQISLGISVSSSSVNGQKPITTVTAFNPISGLIQNQHVNKPITSQPPPLGSLLSSSTVNNQKPIAINSPIGGQSQSNLVNADNKPAEIIVSSNMIHAKQPLTVTTAVNQTTTTASHLQNKFSNIENKPVSSTSIAQQKPMLMSTGSFMPMGDFAQMPNQFFNRPVGTEMLPSFFDGVGNRPPPTADFFSHITDQLNIPLGQQVNRPIESQTAASFVFSSSNHGQMPATIISNSDSLNGQKPVTVVSEVSIETHNQESNKSTGIQELSGSSVSSSALNEQKSVIISNPHSQNRHPSFSGITVSGSSDTKRRPVINAIAFNSTYMQNQPIGERISSGTSVLGSGQQPVTIDMVSNSTFASQLHNKILASSEKITDSDSSVDGQSQFENVEIKPIDRTPVSSGFFTKEKSGIVVTSDNIPTGDFSHMQNKLFNKPLEDQMFLSSFGGFGNSQHPMTDFFSNMKNQLDISMANVFEEQQLNKPIGSQLSAEDFESNNHFSNKGKPAIISSGSHSLHGQPSFSGISVSSSSINGQKPVTVVTAFKPDSEVLIKTHDQQTNKPIENFVSIGSSVFSSSINGQKPVTTVSNVHSQNEQSAFSEMSVSSSSVTKQTPITVVTDFKPGSGTFIEAHNLQTNKSTGNQVSTESLSSNSINVQKPVEMFPPIFEGLVNQQTSKPTGSQISAETFVSSSSINGQKPVAVVINGDSQSGRPTFTEISVTSSFVNGQKPVPVFPASKPEPEVFIGTHNQHVNKPTENQLPSGSYVSSSSITEQKPVLAVSSSHSSYFNEEQPLTVIAANHTATTTGDLQSNPNSVKNKTVEGISVSTTSTTEKEPILSFTDNFHIGGLNQMQNQLFDRPMGSQMFPSLFSGFVNQQANKPTANQAFAGSYITSNSMNVQKPVAVINNFDSQNGQPSFSGVSVSSSSVNGQKPVVVVSAFKPSSEVFIETDSQHTNKHTGNPASAENSVSSGFINVQKPVTIISNSHLQHDQPVLPDISVSSSSVNSQKPVSVVTSFKPDSEFFIEQEPLTIINTSHSSSSSKRQHPIVVTAGNHTTTTTSHLHENHNSVENRPISEISVSTNPITEKDSIISTGNIHIGGYNQMQNQLFNLPMASSTFPSFFGGFANQQTTGSSVSSNSVNRRTPSVIVSNSNSQNKHPSFAGISVSSSSVNGQKPVAVVTAFKPDSEVVFKTPNQETEKPTEHQPSAENFEASSTITGQEPIIINSNSHSQNGQSSFTGISVSSSSVNGQKPVTVATASKPDSEFVLETQNLQSEKPAEDQASAESSTITGQEPTVISSDSHSQNGQSSFTGFSVSSSFVNGQKPITVVTAWKPDSELVLQTQTLQTEKPTGDPASAENVAANSTITGQKTIIISSNSHSQNGQSSFKGISVSSSSVNGQKPVMAVTTFKPDSEVVFKTHNQETEKPAGHQASAENVAASSTITVQKPIIINSNSHSQNGQSSFTGFSVSSSTVNGQKPVIAATALKPDSVVVLEIQNLEKEKPTRDKASVENASSSTINGQESVIISSNFHSIHGKPSFTGISVSSSPADGQKPVTVVTALKPNSEIVMETHNQQNEKLTGNKISIESSSASSSINGQKPVTTVSISHSSSSSNGQQHITVTTANNKTSTTSHLPNHPNTIGGKLAGGITTTATTDKESIMIPTDNYHLEAFNQMQNQLFNRPMGPFSPFFGGFVNQQQPSIGFFSQINNQLTNNIANRPAGQQIFVGSSIQSSSSSNGQKSQTTVTSTDSVTGKVTQTKYESVGGKPVAVFQSVSTSIDGEKAQTVVTSTNPITGEVSKTKYVKNFSEESDDLSDSSFTENVQLKIADSINVTNTGELQPKSSSTSSHDHNIKGAKIIGGIGTPTSSLDSKLGDPETIFTREKHTSEHGEQNSTEENVLVKNVGVSAIDVIKSVRNKSLNEAVGLSVPKEIIAEHASTEVISSINPEPPVTTLITSDPSIGAFTQIKYVPHPYHYTTNFDKLFSQKVIINPEEPIPDRKASTREISWIKHRYSIIDFDKPVEGAIFSTSLFNGQSSQPVLGSTNSLTGKIKQAQHTLSGVNVANVPFRLFFQNWIYPPAEPVPKRVQTGMLQRMI